MRKKSKPSPPLVFHPAIFPRPHSREELIGRAAVEIDRESGLEIRLGTPAPIVPLKVRSNGHGHD